MSKMLIDRALLEQALKAFRKCVPMDGKHAEVDAVFKSLRDALFQEEQKEQDARAEQIMSEIWAQPDQTYEYIGAKLAENMQKAMKNRARVSIEAVRSALAQEEQEPAAHLWQHSETGRTRVVMPDQVVTTDAAWVVVGSLYLHQPRREWQGLTLLERAQIMSDVMANGKKGIDLLICAFEDALRRKNT